ncbi:MAG TPA: hypothetical protein VGB98_10340 [Pyrinomonadaceae bacterium]|jgi:hypothetical protein
MLKSQKNAFLDEIKKSGLSPSLFEAEEASPPQSTPGEPSLLQKLLMFISPELEASYKSTCEVREEPPSFTIVLRGSRLRFSVMQNPADFDLYSYRYRIFQPEYPTRHSRSEKTFDETRRAFKAWLDNTVQRYLTEKQTPDLWLQIKTYKSFDGETPGGARDTSNFTEEEKEVVRRSVNNFKQLIAKNFEPTQEQAEFIDDRLDYLCQAVDRLNRYDWRAVAVSTVIGIFINLSVDTGGGRLLFSLFEQAFQSTFKLLR